MQDTPGYGDDQDISKHIELIVEHIQANNIKWLEMENAKDRCVCVWAGGTCIWVKVCVGSAIFGNLTDKHVMATPPSSDAG